jgi:hypothetical protein
MQRLLLGQMINQKAIGSFDMHHVISVVGASGTRLKPPKDKGPMNDERPSGDDTIGSNS